MSRDAWERSTACARREPDGRWTPQVTAAPDGEQAAGAVLWEGTGPLATLREAEAYARHRRERFIRGARLARAVTDVNLPPEPVPAPDGPAGAPDAPAGAALAAWAARQAAAPWDGDWAALVPGAEQRAGGFGGMLHDKRAPWTVRWRCGHSHPGVAAAGDCTISARRELAAGEPPAPPAAPPQGVQLTLQPGARLRVLAHPAARVSVRAGGGQLEVVIDGPEGDS